MISNLCTRGHRRATRPSPRCPPRQDPGPRHRHRRGSATGVCRPAPPPIAPEAMLPCGRDGPGCRACSARSLQYQRIITVEFCEQRGIVSNDAQRRSKNCIFNQISHACIPSGYWNSLLPLFAISCAAHSPLLYFAMAEETGADSSVERAVEDVLGM